MSDNYHGLQSDSFALQCPFPINDYPEITMAHGGGGRLSQQLLEEMFFPALGNPFLEQKTDGAILELDSSRMAISTDSHVVSPLFFPGGDIGKLAVYGTINDLAVSGARPRYLSAGFILEEGFSTHNLWKILQSMKEAAREAGVCIVTGDTKVVERGKGDGLYLNTTGIGEIVFNPPPVPENARNGDNVILSGDIGRHAVTIMALRGGLEFETSLQSDCAEVWSTIEAILRTGASVHCMRDLTRGGLATALLEIMSKACLALELREEAIPVCREVRAACDLLGLDPLYAANEGRFIIFVPECDTVKVLDTLKSLPHGENACVIGRIVDGSPGQVDLVTRIGTRRVVSMLSGEQLPRIC